MRAARSLFALGVFCLASAPPLASAQGLDDPIAACDIPEIRFAMALDEPDWEVACERGVVGAVRLTMDDEGAIGATLAWRSERAEGRVDLLTLLRPDERSLFEQLVDLRFLPARHGYRRLSLVTQAGEDHASRVEHQLWFRVRRDGRWVVAFGGQVDGSVHVNGTCHHEWRTSFVRAGRSLRRRWRHTQRYDGDDDEGRRACAEEGARRGPRTTRLVDVVLEPLEED